MKLYKSDAQHCTVMPPQGRKVIVFGLFAASLTVLLCTAPALVVRAQSDAPEDEEAPILITTALDDESSIDGAFAAGATDYISKPINFAVLRQRVSRLLQASRAEAHVRRLAYQDSLTGLPNRTLFKERLEVLIGRSSSDQLHAILFLDLNRFKLVNDTLGHEVGDLLLKAAAERLSGCVRSTDTVARIAAMSLRSSLNILIP